jgi:tellurite resistance protein
VRGSTLSEDVLEEGRFGCPVCGEEARYQLLHVQRFQTRYFVPVWPLADYGEHVRCQGCWTRFRLEVLDVDAAETRARLGKQAAGLAARVLALVAIADGTAADGQLAVAREVLGEIAADPPGADELRALIEDPAAAGARVAVELESLGQSLPPWVKTLLVRGAFQVASADGVVTAEEQRVVAKLAQALGLDGSGFRAAVEGLCHGD